MMLRCKTSLLSVRAGSVWCSVNLGTILHLITKQSVAPFSVCGLRSIHIKTSKSSQEIYIAAWEALSSLLCLHRFHRLGGWGFGGCLLCSLLCHVKRWGVRKRYLGECNSHSRQASLIQTKQQNMRYLAHGRISDMATILKSTIT